MAGSQKVQANKIPINRLKAVLADKGKSNADLEKHFGVAQSTVSGWVTNRIQPSVYTFYEIAKYLECDIRELFIPTKQFVKDNNKSE